MTQRAWLCVALLALCLLAAPGAGPAQGVETPLVAALANCTGVWEGSVFFSDVMVYAYQEANTVRGLVRVTGWTGKTSEYHFHGALDGAGIEASHFRGHVFRGRLLPGGEVRGVLTTAVKKRDIELNARRVGDLPPHMATGNF